MASDLLNFMARRRLLVRLCMYVLAPVGLFIAVFEVSSVPVRPAWTAAGSTPTPGRFLYAMFPVAPDVPLRDAPAGKVVGTLTRAVVNSQEEITAGGWVAVRDAGSTSWVELSKLAYLPPPGASVDYFKAFEAAYVARDPGDYRSASLTLEPGAKVTAKATLRLGQDDYWEKYVYEISSGSARPVEMYLVFGPGQALSWCGGIGTAGLSVGVYFILVRIFARDAKERRGAIESTAAASGKA